MRLLCLATAAALLMAAASAAPITLEDAREVVKDATGVSVAGWEGKAWKAGSVELGSFSGQSPEGHNVRYLVDLTRGVFVGWRVVDYQPPEGGTAAVDEQQALKVAREGTARILGARAAGLSWHVSGTDPHTLKVVGTAPIHTDPPARDTGLHCEVEVSRYDQSIIRYEQLVGDDAPLDIRVSADEARKIAEDDFARPEAVLLGAPELRKWADGRAVWIVTFDPAGDEPPHTYDISAKDGSIIAHETPEWGPPPPEIAARYAAQNRREVTTVVVLGCLFVGTLLAGAGAWVIRRVRNGRET